jgi:hypothetical protein
MADTLQQLLRERAEQDTVAVKHGERTWTWRQHIAEAGDDMHPRGRAAPDARELFGVEAELKDVLGPRVADAVVRHARATLPRPQGQSGSQRLHV